MAITTRDGKTQTVLAEINMIPFIDVMLVLLIIFMITAPVVQSGLEINIPETETVRELSQPLLTVSIDSHERLYFEDRPISVSELVETLEREFPDGGLRRVYLRSDREVPFQTVAVVLDLLKQAKTEDIIIVTQPLDRD